MRQDRLMLLIVVNHEKPQIKQPCENTAYDPPCQMEVPKCPRHRARQQGRCGKNIPPTPRGGIHGVRFGCQDNLFSGSHVGSNVLPVWAKSFLLSLPTFNDEQRGFSAF